MYDLLINIFANLVKNNIDWRLVILGEGELRKNPSKKTIKVREKYNLIKINILWKKLFKKLPINIKN
jgi:glycosyltransferase involved in cell wall biosynthesis